jgi:hypothetical protein
MRKLAILTLVVLVGLTLFAGQAWAAKKTTFADVQEMTTAKADSSIRVAVDRAKAEIAPSINAVKDTLGKEIYAVSGQVTQLDRRVGGISSQLSLLEPLPGKIIEVDGRTRANESQIVLLKTNMDNTLQQQDQQISKNSEQAKQDSQANYDALKKDMDGLKAQMNKGSVWRTFEHVALIGFVALAVYDLSAQGK